MKVLHAPGNIAGQPGIIAKAQRELGIEADVMVSTQHQFNYPFDINLSLSEKSKVSKCITLINNFIKCTISFGSSSTAKLIPLLA